MGDLADFIGRVTSHTHCSSLNMMCIWVCLFLGRPKVLLLPFGFPLKPPKLGYTPQKKEKRKHHASLAAHLTPSAGQMLRPTAATVYAAANYVGSPVWVRKHALGL